MNQIIKKIKGWFFLPEIGYEKDDDFQEHLKRVKESVKKKATIKAFITEPNSLFSLINKFDKNRTKKVDCSFDSLKYPHLVRSRSQCMSFPAFESDKFFKTKISLN